MEDNEKVEETTETNDEELETNDEETDEETQDEETNDNSEDDTPTLEDYQRLKKEAETLKAQKEHWRKKAQASKLDLSKDKSKQEEIKKTNQENPDFEETMDIRFLKRDGYSEEDIEKLRIIKAGYASQGKNITLIDAVNDELFKSIEEKRKLQEKKEKAQLGANGKPLSSTKEQMSPEEFEKFRKDKSKEFLRNMGFNS